MPECDRSFLKDLRTLDKRLSVKFNGAHHVVCYDRGHGDPVNIYCVKSDDGGYRQPDRRDLEIIKRGDLATGESMDVRLRKTAYISELMRKEIRRKTHEMIRDHIKDDKNQLRRWIGDRSNSSKSNSEFRRIPHKPSKNTVMTSGSV